MNSVTVSGNLGQVPEVKEFGSGAKVVQLSVAVNCGYYDKKAGEWKNNTAWVNVKCWNKTGDRVLHLAKGDAVAVVGKLDAENYVTKDGKKVNKLIIVADSVEQITKTGKGSVAQNGMSSGSFGSESFGESSDAFDTVASMLGGDDSPF